MFKVYAAEPNVVLNPVHLLNGNSFLYLLWILAVVGFIAVFSFTLVKTRNLALSAKYGSWLTIFVIALVIPLLIQQHTNQKSNADITLQPQDVIIKQENFQTIHITWQTNKPAIQIVEYKNDGINQIILDDKGAIATEIHSVHITNIHKNITYSFDIRGDTIYTKYNNIPLHFTLSNP